MSERRISKRLSTRAAPKLKFMKAATMQILTDRDDNVCLTNEFIDHRVKLDVEKSSKVFVSTDCFDNEGSEVVYYRFLFKGPTCDEFILTEIMDMGYFALVEKVKRIMVIVTNSETLVTPAFIGMLAKEGIMVEIVNYTECVDMAWEFKAGYDKDEKKRIENDAENTGHYDVGKDNDDDDDDDDEGNVFMEDKVKTKKSRKKPQKKKPQKKKPQKKKKSRVKKIQSVSDDDAEDAEDDDKDTVPKKISKLKQFKQETMTVEKGTDLRQFAVGGPALPKRKPSIKKEASGPKKRASKQVVVVKYDGTDANSVHTYDGKSTFGDESDPEPEPEPDSNLILEMTQSHVSVSDVEPDPVPANGTDENEDENEDDELDFDALLAELSDCDVDEDDAKTKTKAEKPVSNKNSKRIKLETPKVEAEQSEEEDEDDWPSGISST
ncbi:MAG: hypothetical protein ACTSUE_05515 [Promethearchaeota archaeon]